MYITSEIIKDHLSTLFHVTEYGKKLCDLPLLLPAFYLKDTIPVAGGVYIVRGNELPENSRIKCLYICFGTAPVQIPRNYRAEILYLSGESPDYLSVFNQVQKIYDKVLQWECKLQNIVDRSCNIEEMLFESIPIFENRITIIDYNLNILAYCESTTVNGKKESRICHSFDRVPHEKSLLFDEDYKNKIFYHTPYHFIETDTGKDNYCINLFLDKEYIGTCALMEDQRAIRQSDYLLFQKFSEYITSALSKQSTGPGGKYVTLKSILLQLLQSMPISKSELMQALEINSLSYNGDLPPSDWVCVTLQSSNRDKQLPEGYLCAALEQLLPMCSALSYDSMIVCVLPVAESYKEIPCIAKTLSPILQDMNFQAGCSLPFHDLFKLQVAYQQTLCAIHTGKQLTTAQRFYNFRDYLSDYMLQNCCGSFDIEDLLIPELNELRHLKGSVDYWSTLKCYLDHECNASETAKDMYLHRSSLLPRLKKIREYVDLSSSKNRLLLRLLMNLYSD